MKYLKEAMNIDAEYSEWKKAAELPYLITDRYSFKAVKLEGREVVFAYPKGETDAVSSVKKHMKIVSGVADLPLVLILNSCSARQRKALIASSIPFVVENRQIFLPFMGTLLEERYSSERVPGRPLIPSTEALLFYFIHKHNKELAMNGLAVRFGVSAMTVTRAASELEKSSLLQTHKDGVNKILTSDISGKELYERAIPLLRSPVKKTVYIEKESLPENALKAGLSALSELSMLSPPRVPTYATELPLSDFPAAASTLTDADSEVRLELWSYDPHILSDTDSVDILSLVQSLKDDPDERVQKEIRLLLEKFWEESKLA